jgi:ribulose-phosphate 3-epimerase
MPEYVDLILLMTVNPGFGGQRFIESSLPRIRQLREMLTAQGLGAELEVDGGINAETAPRVVAAGASVLVVGEAIFGAREGVAEAMRRIRESLQTVT